jgi:hypothetical protein
MKIIRMTYSSCLLGSSLLLLMLCYSGTAMAIPALQLGPGVGDWNYVDGTWVTTDTNPLQLKAYANATSADGGDGFYAWDTAGEADQFAYLVISVQPKLGFDGFDVSVMNDAVSLSLFTSGVGTPPLEDSNSIPGHGIFNTYFEIYEFQFDGALTTIENTQPPGGEFGMGYAETFDITVNSLAPGVDGIHFDLFAVAGDGQLVLGASDDKGLVTRFAPPSHDAGLIPEPSAALVFSLGLLLVGRHLGIRKRKEL